MRVLLAGPIATSALADQTGIDLSGLPPATAQTPIAPLASGLLNYGHEVHVLTLDSTIDIPLTFKRGPMTVTYCPLRAGPRYRARVRMKDFFAVEISHLSEVMRAVNCDVVHAHWTYEYAEAAVRSGKPHLVTMHDLGWDYLYQFRDAYRLMRLMMKLRTVPRVRNLSVVSSFMLPKLWHYGFCGTAHVVPNPIGASSWSAKQLKGPTLVAVGNSLKIKNIGMAVDAFRLIKRDHPEAELHLFGPGLESNSPLIKEARGVTGHGNVSHGRLMKFLEEKATLLIHPSRLETFGVILGEAKMRGVPVIAGCKSGGTVDVVGKAGLLCDIRSPKAIAQAALSLLNDPIRYAALQSLSHEDMVARFSVSAVAESYIELYKSLRR